MRSSHLLFLLFVLLLSSTLVGQVLTSTAQPQARPEAWAYDPGPDVETQKDLINLYAKIPNFPAISLEIMRYSSYGRPTQKFRPAFGPIPWRMMLKPNHVKILFIGQDGTHIAEAANRPGTAGFGGRAHSLAAFFGVEYSAAFINTYAFTIKGQYGARGAPYVYKGKLKTQQIVPNDVWLMTQDPDSPIAKWRNDLIEWIINNNRQSLKLIVLFGGSAKDSIASFIESRGGKVGSHFERKMDDIQVPEFFLTSSGGNGEFPVPFDRYGEDAYRNLLGRYLKYTDSETPKTISAYLKKHPEEAIDAMVFSRAGPYNNGLLHHAQLGGYDLDKIWVKRAQASNRKPTRSLKGLKLKKGGEIDSDILVLSLPHPTYLSSSKNEAAMRHWESALKEEDNAQELTAKINRAPSYKKLDAMLEVLEELPDSEQAQKIRAEGYNYGNEKVANLVEKDVAKLRPYQQRGWHITPDPSAPNAKRSNKNRFAQGKQYHYGRESIHPAYYDFGTPENRMVSSSTARRGEHKMRGSRKRRGAQIIIFGSRDVPSYDYKLMDQMLTQQPNKPLDSREVFIARLVRGKARYQFDPGPPAKYAQLMQSISSAYSSLFAAKQDMSFKHDGIDAYIIKTHPSIGAFGHYRGTFENPRVVILADPDGVDDLVTARALTGTRGQYLQRMMEDLGVKDNYLIIKTVPFGMDDAADEDWQRAYKLTQKWRDKLMKEILRDTNPDWLLADGAWAQKTIAELLKKQKRLNNKYSEKYVPIYRKGRANGSGIAQAMRTLDYSSRYRAKMSNIPRTHLTYYARAWEGTSGDRVMDSKDRTSERYQGLAFQVVVPNWVVKQKHKLKSAAKKAVEKMKAKLRQGGFPMPDEDIPDFLERTSG